MEFDIEPNNAYFLWDKSYIEFTVDLPETVVPDNFFCSLLHENLECRISYVTTTNKTSENDYALTNYFMKRINWDECVLHKVGVLEGIYSSKNLDATTLKSQMDNEKESINNYNEVNTRRLNTEEKTINSVKHFRHYFRAPINCGFSWTGRPLPKDVPIKLIFFRAKAEKSVVSIVDPIDDKAFPKRSLRMDNVQLVACMITSDYYDRKYSPYRLSKIDFPFMNPIIRREVLVSGHV